MNAVSSANIVSWGYKGKPEAAKVDAHLFNHWAVDSFKIRIPYRLCAVIDHEMRDIVARVSTSTGEVLEERENTKSSRDEHGIKTEFSIEKRATQHDTVKYVVVLVNSKQLKELYFEGITLSNIRKLHAYLMSLNTVHFTFEDFMQGECTDIDFRKDFNAPDHEMREVFRHLQAHAQPSPDFDKGSKLFWREDNKGLQFNKRNNTNTASAPFVKIYSKTTDLRTKSNVFALSHFETIPEDLWRIEFTIKNKRHLASFGHGNSLGAVLGITEEGIEAMSKRTLQAVLNRNTTVQTIPDQDTIPPRDVYECNALIMLLDSGHAWHTIKETLLGSQSRANRSKYNKRMEHLYSSYIRPIERYSNASGVSDILEQIGYTF